MHDYKETTGLKFTFTFSFYRYLSSFSYSYSSLAILSLQSFVLQLKMHVRFWL